VSSVKQFYFVCTGLL